MLSMAMPPLLLPVLLLPLLLLRRSGNPNISTANSDLKGGKAKQ